MTRLLAGELLKVRTTRTAFGFAIAALLLALATVLIVSLAGGGPETIRDKRSAIAFGSVISAVLLIYGVVGATGEFRHRTLAPAVLIAPDRYRLVVARMLAYGFTAGLAAAAIGAIVYLIGIPLLNNTHGPDLEGADYLGVAVGGILASILCAVLGVAIGTLVRNQVGAVVGLLVWIFVMEPLLSIPSADLSDYTIGASAGILGQGGNADGTMGHAFVVLMVWTLLLSLAAIVVDRRRDVE
jgi:hypothetical protein